MNNEIRTKLAAPFKYSEIEWRIQSCWKSGNDIKARVLAYVQARAIMDRLDDVVGIFGWSVNYTPSEKGFIASLGISCGDQFKFKEDGAEQTNIEPFKGGLSSAFKRAASVWGIGRYLYSLEVGWAVIVEKSTKGAHYTNDKQIGSFYWLPPELPDWALPEGERFVDAVIEKKSPQNTLSSKSIVILKEQSKNSLKQQIENLNEAFPGSHQTSKISKPKCTACGGSMLYGKQWDNYYCENYKDKSCEHSKFKAHELSSFLMAQDNQDVPF